MPKGTQDPKILRKMIKNIEEADRDGSADFLKRHLMKKVEKIESSTQKNDI